MAGTEEVTRAMHTSMEERKGMRAKFQEMSSELIQIMNAFRRTREAITGMMLRATRPQSPAAIR